MNGITIWRPDPHYYGPDRRERIPVSCRYLGRYKCTNRASST